LVDAAKVGDSMADDNPLIKGISEKVDSLTKDLAAIREELKALGSISDIVKKVETIDSTLGEIKKFDKVLGGLATSKDSEAVSKKIDELSKAVKGFEGDIQVIKDAKETEVIIKKIDDILLTLVDADVLGKKLDDLQGYVAGLSGLEEKVEDLASQFAETNEIVGIIVRQLDDIERKYNLSIDKINETAELVAEIAAKGPVGTSDTKSTEKKPTKNTEDTAKEDKPQKKPPTSKANLPSTIDALMGKLLEMVNPQTEAKDMAVALEEVRDELTPMITVHTPVIFQFGKKARELKSYPPTATLNENDIATLNKEIKAWQSKLKEIAKSS
jgi:uncharacterized protein YoxC